MSVEPRRFPQPTRRRHSGAPIYSAEVCGNVQGKFDEEPALLGADQPRPHHSTQRFKLTLTAGHYFDDGTVGTDPPLHPGPRRVRTRVVPVPRRGFQLV